ncbi:diphosphomevalonate decarboxylase [Candidatus Micrarchaeota archaeon]|nr:diphosphomevalonate decarboxylase [Candidatus Micrarchaeota archaeon]
MKTTATANANIAVIKYWGRRNDELVLPYNNSISFTMDELQTKTTVEFVDGLKADELILDGKVATEKELLRVQNFLDIIRTKIGTKKHAKVVSKNSFAKSAGLASSAAAFAALAKAATKAAGMDFEDKQLSMLARRGSGSASRSIHGGAVEWLAGKREDGEDCYAIQLSKPNDWPELRNVIAISSEHEKKVGSAAGMKFSVQNSALFKSRLESVEERAAKVREAIKKRDFGTMARSIMQESNNMHAVMLDSWPPLIYLNEVSFRVIDAIIDLNSRHSKEVAAYTFDAGPNAHIYTTNRHEKEVKEILDEINGVQKTIIAKVGEGAKINSDHLF